MPGPARSASSSVARPMSAAVGITPIAEVAKISAALASTSSSATAMRDERHQRVGPAVAAEQEVGSPRRGFRPATGV